MLGLLHGLASITLRGNQVISGLAINILASGLTVTVGIAMFQQGGQTPNLARAERFRPIELPFAEQLGGIPIIGTIYREVISGHNILVWIALGLVGASAEARATATLLAACPTAVNVFIQTRAFGVFARGAAEAVVAGTVLSALTLTLIAHFLS